MIKRFIKWVLPKYDFIRNKQDSSFIQNKVYVEYKGQLCRFYWENGDLIIISKVKTKGWFE